MKKFFIIFNILLIIVFSGVYIKTKQKNDNLKIGETENIEIKEKGENKSSLDGKKEIGNNYEKKSDLDESKLKQEKLQILKNRFRLKNIISKGDKFFQNDQLLLALLQYKKVLKENPDDYLVKRKIGDILFEMKNFGKANIYYKELLNEKKIDSSLYIQTLFYSNDLSNKSSRDYIKSNLDKYISNKEQVYFYKNSLNCLEDFHNCKKSYEDKLYQLNGEPKTKELKEIKKSLETYAHFGLDDIYYKNSLLVGAFMKLKMYPISIKLGKDILKEKPNYKVILQIIAQSYFELGDYKNANIYLKKYLRLEPKDAKSAYLLGIINIKLKAFVLSNIYFEKAMSLGYYDTINLRRKIIYNYYMLGDTNKMYKTFDELLKTEKELVLDDFNIMINYAVSKNDYSKIVLRARKGISLFPKEVDFYGYIAEAYYNAEKYDIALKYAKKGFEIDKTNQYINYVYGLLKIKSSGFGEAELFFKNALKKNINSILATKIKKELNKLELKKHKSELDYNHFDNILENE